MARISLKNLSKEELKARRRLQASQRRALKPHKSTRKKFKKFNLTQKQFYIMTAYQHNRCAVCHETFTETPRIDHDHTTRNVRGLLCNRCNLGLGYFRDNVTILSNAIEYLEKGPQKYAVSYKQSLPVITPVKPYR